MAPVTYPKCEAQDELHEGAAPSASVFQRENLESKNRATGEPSAITPQAIQQNLGWNEQAPGGEVGRRAQSSFCSCKMLFLHGRFVCKHTPPLSSPKQPVVGPSASKSTNIQRAPIEAAPPNIESAPRTARRTSRIEMEAMLVVEQMQLAVEKAIEDDATVEIDEVLEEEAKDAEWDMVGNEAAQTRAEERPGPEEQTYLQSVKRFLPKLPWR